jgi:hypothetical protein
MGLETISIPEKKKDIPSITDEEYLQYLGGNKENLEEWLQKKGIEPDEDGCALINIGGKIEKVDITDDIGHIIEIDKEDSED